MDEWRSNRAKMSSKVGIEEPVRIYSRMLSNPMSNLIKVKIIKILSMLDK